MKRREKYGADQRGWLPAIWRETYEHARGMTGREKERDGLIYTTGDRFGACNIGHHTTIRHVLLLVDLVCAYRRDAISFSSSPAPLLSLSLSLSLSLCLSLLERLDTYIPRFRVIRVSCCVRVVNLRRVLGPTKSPPSLGRGVRWRRY